LSEKIEFAKIEKKKINGGCKGRWVGLHLKLLFSGKRELQKCALLVFFSPLQEGLSKAHGAFSA
jgi:hypothetical protein